MIGNYVKKILRGREVQQKTKPVSGIEYFSGCTAEQGLQVLETVGLELNDLEKETFMKFFGHAYEDHERHFISAVCNLYGGLPFLSGTNKDRNLGKERMSNFTKRFNSTSGKSSWKRE